jgi:hypothetical protein
MSPQFDIDERLDEAKERGVGVNMPVPLHERIEDLCDLVYQAGCARPTKRKMLAALVLGYSSEANELQRLLGDYDRARVADALVAATPEGSVVSFPRRVSGPRPKSRNEPHGR